MIKYIFFMFVIINMLHINNLVACPCGFSPDDERPFFEQYEVGNDNTNAQKKDEKS
jgi:hypothetical protein